MIAAQVRHRIVPGGVEISAREWPGAPWTAAACLVLALPLLVWAAWTGHAVEGGGAFVVTSFGLLAAWLATAKRRDVVVSAGPSSVTVKGREGAGPFARPVDLTLPARCAAEIHAFATPDGAPALDDRGGDLVLATDGARIRLARATGPGWRERLDPVAAALRASGCAV